MASSHSFLDKLIDKFSNSRDFTISVVLHLLLILIFGTTVLFKVVQPPSDFQGDPGGFVQEQQQAAPPPPQQTQVQPQFNPASVVPPPPSASVSAIVSTAPSAVDFSMSAVVSPPNPAAPPPSDMAPAPPTAAPDTMSMQQATAIKAFTQSWSKGGYGGTRSREFNFTAYLGQYQGGNWDSTVRVINGEITMGSLPNLLYFMNVNSRDKIKTNYKQVKALRLDNDEIFTTKPPFIFLTGTRDFVLSDQEVSNLRKYVQLGGCIWGDSSVPGARSSFDLAFRREMKRVLPDVDKKFEPLPANHPIYTAGYFSEIRGVPKGLNYYQESVYALRMYGEIAIIYTANDYGDMWQIGLDQKNQIDLREDANRQLIAINKALYKQRGIYCKNLELPSLVDAYKFGTNIVIHLLTRWEDKVRSAPTSSPL